jgi:hypothetical protein
MRNAQDPEFCNYVDAIGEDLEGAREIQLRMIPNVADEQIALEWLFPDPVLSQPDVCIKRSFLAVLNVQVDHINDLILDRLPGRQSRSP